MKEFEINTYMKLKLEEDTTIIYIAGEKFKQCKFLLIDIPINKLESFEEIDSVDEVAEQLDDSLERFNPKMFSSETEFWAHCSNLQVWAENNYNTRLLHRNLAFPLLKKLTEVGDPRAKIIFEEEIAKRFESGYPPVTEYLIMEGYLQYLPEEFVQDISINIEFLENIVFSIDEKPYLKKGMMKYINSLRKGEPKSNRGVMNLNLEEICKIYEEIYNSYAYEEYEYELLNGNEIFIWEILRKEISKSFFNLETDLIKDLFKIFDDNHENGFILINEFLNKDIIIPLIRCCLESESLLKKEFITQINERLKINEKIYTLVNLINCYVRYSDEKKLDNRVKSLILKILTEDNLSEFSNYVRLKLLKYLNIKALISLFENDELRLLKKILLAIDNKISYENYNWSFNELKEYNYSEFLEWWYELSENLGEKLSQSITNTILKSIKENDLRILYLILDKKLYKYIKENDFVCLLKDPNIKSRANENKELKKIMKCLESKIN